jgi:hypothetical protein
MPSGLVQAQPQQSHMPSLQSKQPGPVMLTFWLAAMQCTMHAHKTTVITPIYLLLWLLWLHAQHYLQIPGMCCCAGTPAAACCLLQSPC